MPLNIEKIKELMEGRNQVEIAWAAGMKQPNLARVLSGKFDPKLSTVERLARALGCRVEELLA